MTSSFLRSDQLDIDQIRSIIEDASKYKRSWNSPLKTHSKQSFLTGLLFFEPSTRTRMSFEVATLKLGGQVYSFEANASTSLSKGESMEDTFHAITTMKPDVLVVRCGQDFDLESNAAKAWQDMGVKVINAGWGLNSHPTQALLDVFTFTEVYSELKNLNVLFVGDTKHSRVFSSHRRLLPRLGANLAVCGPKDWSAKSDGITHFNDLSKALAWADAVVSLRVQFERHDEALVNKAEYVRNYQISENLLRASNYDGAIFHPGPVNWGIELHSEVRNYKSLKMWQQKEKWCVFKSSSYGILNFLKKKGVMMNATGYLVLEDGTLFEGEFLGGVPKAGEVVFNTSHHGYEEIATDPSYYGQIMVMSSPMQGNYGVGQEFCESDNYWIRGFIALDIHMKENSWIAKLIEKEVPILNGVDTRQLVIHLREKGTLKGTLVKSDSKEKALELAKPYFEEFAKWDSDWVNAVTSKESKQYEGSDRSGPKVALMDYGYKANILRELLKRSCAVKVFPARTPAEEVLSWNPDGVLLSNGPGDPAEVQESVAELKKIIGKKVCFGICMGSQLMGRALGLSTYALKFGHHGANHPVKDLRTGQIYMTSQNHGYALSSELPEDVTVTHVNLNDNTVSGISNESQKCFSVQFHPENCPGPTESVTLFDEFFDRIKNEL